MPQSRPPIALKLPHKRVFFPPSAPRFTSFQTPVWHISTTPHFSFRSNSPRQLAEPKRKLKKAILTSACFHCVLLNCSEHWAGRHPAEIFFSRYKEAALLATLPPLLLPLINHIAQRLLSPQLCFQLLIPTLFPASSSLLATPQPVLSILPLEPMLNTFLPQPVLSILPLRSPRLLTLLFAQLLPTLFIPSPSACPRGIGPPQMLSVMISFHTHTRESLQSVGLAPSTAGTCPPPRTEI